MKLGIISIYLVDEENMELMELQLEMLKKHTKSEYTIYGVVVRANDIIKDYLQKRDEVKLFDIDETNLRGAYEHTYYLEHLIKSAIDDDCSHIAIFHLDSFPIVRNWDIHTISLLNEKTVLVSSIRHEECDRKPFTAFMLFEAEFYQEYKPKFLLDELELKSLKYNEYKEKVPHSMESGYGFGYKLYEHGLDWQGLGWSNKSNNHRYFGVVHGGLIYHLGGATQKENSFPDAKPSLIKRTRKAILNSMPHRFKYRLVALIFKVFPGIINLFPDLKFTRKAFEKEREMLLKDSNAYFQKLLKD